MGLCLYAKGFKGEIYDSGYVGFTHFRIAVAKAYNEELGLLYEKWIKSCICGGKPLTNDEWDRMNALLPKGLEILVSHSDCDGKLTPKECKLIYDDIKDLECDYPQVTYGWASGENQLEVFKKALLHCWKRRVNMWFT